ncbi:MAG: hypothetical protein AAF721_07255 [Myxococcota bacterium]
MTELKRGGLRLPEKPLRPGPIPGHPMCCALGDDTDGDGWWVYIDFEAAPAEWAD